MVARAYMALDSVAEARETVAVGAEHARRMALELDLARLLLLAAELGGEIDPRLGTTEPVEEANRLLDRLGVVVAVTT